MKPTDFSTHLSKFFHEYLARQRGSSQHTVRSYRDTFKLLLQFFQRKHGVAPEKLSLDHLSPDAICEFLADLGKSRSSSPRTRNQRLASIHSFLRYLQLEAPDRSSQIQRILAIPRCKWRTVPVRYLSIDEVVSLLSAPDKCTREGRRDAALLTMLYDTAARVQELADVSVRDVRLSSPPHVALTGKGNKTRIVPLMDVTASIIREHIAENNLSGTERQDAPLFTNRNGGRLTRFGIDYILKKHFRASKSLKPSAQLDVSPHTLRHSKAMHLLEAGNSVVVIQSILGHADVKTTSTYARANVEMMRKALSKTTPPGKKDARTPWHSNPELMEWLQSL